MASDEAWEQPYRIPQAVQLEVLRAVARHLRCTKPPRQRLAQGRVRLLHVPVGGEEVPEVKEGGRKVLEARGETGKRRDAGCE